MICTRNNSFSILILYFPADPKASQTTKLKTNFKRHPKSDAQRRAKDKDNNTRDNANEQECKQVLGKMPYQCDTVFGYITLVDPVQNVKKAIYGQLPYQSIANLDEGENKILDLMIQGRFYSHTGKLFVIYLTTYINTNKVQKNIS